MDLIACTVRTLDSFTNSCTRLCIIVDGLDSFEQARVVQLIEIVHLLFTSEGDPFINILTVDRHVLIRGIEQNLTSVFQNGAVNSHNYLKNIIHLPVFLNVDLTLMKRFKRMNTPVTFKSVQSNTDVIFLLNLYIKKIIREKMDMQTIRITKEN